MLGGIFQKRKKIQELRAPSLQDIKRFREVYGRYADKQHVESPACFERSIYKAISCQKELHSLDFRQEDVTDPQIIALAETLIDLPMVSSLDLRDNKITDEGAKAILEVLRLQIITAKTPQRTDPKTKKVIPQVAPPEFTRFVTSVNLKGNDISADVLQELAQYCDILRREDKRLEIRASLNQIDRTSDGLIDEEDLRSVLKLLTGTEPSKKEAKQLMNQSAMGADSAQNAITLENVLLAKCSSSPTKNSAACPPWEAIVQIRHASIGPASTMVPIVTRSVDFPRSPDSKQQKQPTFVSTDEIQVRCRSPERNAQIQSSHAVEANDQSVQVLRTQMHPSTEAASIGQMPARSPPTPSPPSIVIPAESPPRPKVEFRPPASPPPPLPLPQTPTAEKHESFSSANRFRDSSLSDGSEEGSNSSVRQDTNAPPAPRFVRQDSGDARRQVTPQSRPSLQTPKDDATSEIPQLCLPEECVSREDKAMSIASPVKENQSNANAPSCVAKTPSSSLLRLQGSQSQQSASAPSPLGTVNPPDAGETFDVESSGDLWNSGHELEDLSSLVYGDSLDAIGSIAALSPASSRSHAENQSQDWSVHAPDLNEDEEEQVESIVIDIMKGGKPRNIAKVLHSEFKRGMALQEFPGDIPFRNVVALILSGNGLRDLGLFKKCRFPCTLVLDLSQNQLTKLSDVDLMCFPKLQVLDLSRNCIKTISGLGKLFVLKALNLSHNQIKTVINIEHLVNLQILLLRSNAITASSALRLLSLNKSLTYLDLDDNALVETDDHQRRKVTVHILNIIPTLSSFGSVPIIGHNTKDKKKLQTVDASMGKSLLEHEEYPDLRAIWASNACDILQIFQDRDVEPKAAIDSDDLYGDLSGIRNSPTRGHRIGRDEQRQKDELRSKSVGYRSRAKAPPSPTHIKMSPFAFGPPLPTPPRKSPKKKPVVDRERAEEQKRRANQLSAPKHPPVDTNQLKQEQRRKSRPTFDVNMSVAERLQLVREKSLRRPSTTGLTAGSFHRNSSTLPAQQARRDSDHPPALVMEIRSPRSTSGGVSPRSVEFRVEPFPAGTPQYRVQGERPPTSPSQRAMDTKSQHGEQPTATDATDRKPSLKESNFLQSLAVTDFLTHAEEEISTAVTALNVLLSMCERVPSDHKKLQDYRESLNALDILNERESLELFQRAKQHEDPLKVKECTEAFDKLGTLKRCIKDLLEKLDEASPGSQTVHAYCSALRATELRHIIIGAEDEEPEAKAEPVHDHKTKASPPSTKQPEDSKPTPQGSPNQSLHSRLFSSVSEDHPVGESDVSDDHTTENQSRSHKAADDDEEFGFLSERSPFDDDLQLEKGESSVENDRERDESATNLADETVHDSIDAVRNKQTDASPERQSIECDDRKARDDDQGSEETTLDVTQDIQQADDGDDDADFDFDTELCLNDGPTNPVTEHTEMIEDSTVSQPQLHESVEEEPEDAYDFAEREPSEPEVTPALDGDGDGEQEEEEEELEPEKQNAEPDMVVTEQVEVEEPLDDDGGDEVPVPVGPADETEDADDDAGVAEAEDEDDEEAEIYGDWEKGFDPSTNHYFWFNHASGESQWVPPEGWPYEVDTPFEEDEEEAEPNDAEDEYDQPQDQEADDSGAAVRSSVEDDDELFSDTDLPEF